MNLKKADSADFDIITAFYRYTASHTENMEKFGRWIYGKHPTDEIIRSYLEEGCLYYTEQDGEILTAAAVTGYQSEDYHAVEWGIQIEDEEAAVVHLLCTNPKNQKQGAAGELMREILRVAATARKKAVRLDVLSCNAPAIRLYEFLGFQRRGVQNWYASNTGWIDFYLYEYIL